MRKFNEIIVFTDGSCCGNNCKIKKTPIAGIGIYFPCSEFNNVSEPFTITPITNQRAELYAIYKTLKIVTEKCTFKKLFIYSDSLYSIRAVTLWIDTWEKNGWKTANKEDVKNLDIIKPIYEILNKYNSKIFFQHVKAHTGGTSIEAIFNKRVDELACEGTNKNIVN